MRKIKFTAVILTLGLIFTGCSVTEYDNSESTTVANVEMPDGTATVCYIDVGQGDSELIMTDSYNILIDGGERGHGDDVEAVLDEYNIKTIDCLIVSHMHSDHMGGITDILNDMVSGTYNIEIKQIITGQLDNSVVPTTKIYATFLEDVDKLDIPFNEQEANTVQDIPAGGGTLETISSPFTDDKNLNNESVVAIFKYGNTNFVFEGDAEQKEEKALVSEGRYNGVHADVLKLGHHGSNTASTDELLSAVQPSAAVISCGAGNKYGHPHKETLDKISQYTDKIYRTDLDGTIIMQSDGNTVKKVN